MNLNDIRDLDFSDLGNAPLVAKIFVLSLVLLTIFVLGYMFQVKDQRSQLASVESVELELRATFEARQHRAANLDAYREQLEEMESLLDTMLKQLPSKTEMPELLIDISQTALATGIQNELFEPGTEQINGFYAERPIKIRMLGTYHQFGQFISGVASLPRVVILTVSDIELEPVENSGTDQDLRMQGTIKTYRYLDEDEILQQDAGEVVP